MKSIAEIRRELAETKPERLPEAVRPYETDERDGVRKLVQAANRRYAAYEKECRRIDQMRLYEKKYSEYELVCGIDEAGRGPLAGPVVAAAVILPRGCSILYVDDSKKLSPKKREELYDEIRSQAVAVGVGIVDHRRIDEINILQATYEAMRQAVEAMGVIPELLLNDAVRIPGLLMRQVPIIHGDAKSITIASASIIAKVTRDRLMVELAGEYPQYGFESNKGYGSAAHIAALKEYGPCPIHRRTFIRNFL